MMSGRIGWRWISANQRLHFLAVEGELDDGAFGLDARQRQLGAFASTIRLCALRPWP